MSIETKSMRHSKIAFTALILAVITNAPINAQQNPDTTYFDKNGKRLVPQNRLKAFYYELHGFNRIESGQVVRYKMDDTKHSIRTYLNYELNGQFIDFYPNGKIKRSGVYKDGKPAGLVKERYENGNMKQTVFHGEGPDILYMAYRPNGQMMVLEGKGFYQGYDPECQCEVEGSYENGLKTGMWTGTSESDIVFKEEYGPKGLLEQGVSYDSAGQAFEYVSLKTEPKYKRGYQAWSAYLERNLRYPEMAASKGIEGNVFVLFEVVDDGIIENVKIIRGVGAGCDEEAKRVIKKSAAGWLCGRERGRPVKTSMQVQIVFSLN